MTIKNIRELCSEIAKREGGKSEVSIGNIREIIRVFSDVIIDNDKEILNIFVDYTIRRANRRKKK
jgi:hypothetical protein